MGITLVCEAQFSSHCWRLMTLRVLCGLLEAVQPCCNKAAQDGLRQGRGHTSCICPQRRTSAVHFIFDLHIFADTLCSVYWTSALTTGLLLSAGSG